MPRVVGAPIAVLTAEYASSAIGRGLEVIIAGAGGAAHLAGVVAAHTILPVIGVPMQSAALNGLDSLLSIVQMPKGVPVATVAIGASGAANAGLLAAAILATSRPALRATAAGVSRRAGRRRREAVASFDPGDYVARATIGCSGSIVSQMNAPVA